MRIALIGATGFVGSYLIDELVFAGHDLSLLVRPGSEPSLRQAQRHRVVAGDIADASALEAVTKDCDAIIYLVGILRENLRDGVTFEATQYQGVVDTIDAAKHNGVRRFLLMSANGAKQPGTPYQETKRRAEDHVLNSDLDATVFRPSLIFGNPRGHMEIATQLYQDMIRPPLPAIGFHTGFSAKSGDIQFSPVYVEDIATAFTNALENPATHGRRIDLGGPEVVSWREMLRRVARASGKKKWIVPMPIAFMSCVATLFDRWSFFPVTRDQLTMLAEGNTASPEPLRELIDREPRLMRVRNLRYL